MILPTATRGGFFFHSSQSPKHVIQELQRLKKVLRHRRKMKHYENKTLNDLYSISPGHIGNRLQ